MIVFVVVVDVFNEMTLLIIIIIITTQTCIRSAVSSFFLFIPGTFHLNRNSWKPPFISVEIYHRTPGKKKKTRSLCSYMYVALPATAGRQLLLV